jgi:hypothetical protein
VSSTQSGSKELTAGLEPASDFFKRAVTADLCAANQFVPSTCGPNQERIIFDEGSEQLPGALLGHHHAIEHYPGTRSKCLADATVGEFVYQFRIYRRPVIVEIRLIHDGFWETVEQRVRREVKPWIWKKPLLQRSRKSCLAGARASDDDN